MKGKGAKCVFLLTDISTRSYVIKLISKSTAGFQKRALKNILFYKIYKAFYCLFCSRTFSEDFFSFLFFRF